MTQVIGFRPTAEDERIISSESKAGETRSDVLRRALRALSYESWLERARADAARLSGENLGDEKDVW
ncbi:MAG: hypothetical protein LBR32_11185 [Propionibacteriaceae bacterium]|jgi:antitoxin ParD1/3/4|nr:hypothetical protein [Propionibacteriaceae bacterium]